jgi:hypothetical protein
MKNTNNIRNNAKIVISQYGSGIAVGISGSKDQIQQTFNRFFNWGGAAPTATFMRSSQDCEMEFGEMGDAYLHEIGETFSYFLSTDESMVKAMSAEYLAHWQDTPISKQYKGERSSKKSCGMKFREDAMKAANDEYNSFERENFMQFTKSQSPLFSKLDGGAPSLDSSSVNYFSSHCYV